MHERCLKYFGKTISKNPTKYRGSGTYWKLFLAKYPGKVTTEIVAVFEDGEKDKCREFAIAFSIQNDIVKSNDWAKSEK